MKQTTKVLMKYLYRQAWKEKLVTLDNVVDWIREGKYQHRVEAVRGGRTVAKAGAMFSGPIAAEDLPMVMPSKGEKGAYTGLVLLSFRISDGFERLNQLRKVVNLWEQTLLSFVGASGQSLKVLIPYRLTGGGLPTDAAQVALFQQYAYKRAAEYALPSTGIKVEEVVHDGTEHFRISDDPAVYYNAQATPIEMVPRPSARASRCGRRTWSASSSLSASTLTTPCANGLTDSPSGTAATASVNSQTV